MRLEFGAQDKLEMPSLGGETTFHCVRVSLDIHKNTTSDTRDNTCKRNEENASTVSQTLRLCLDPFPSRCFTCMQVGFPFFSNIRDKTRAQERNDPRTPRTILWTFRAREKPSHKKKKATKKRKETEIRSSSDSSHLHVSVRIVSWFGRSERGHDCRRRRASLLSLDSTCLVLIKKTDDSYRPCVSPF